MIEKEVEYWLNQNKEWFKTYAIEHLDLNTVDKWLKSNNVNVKEICKCNSSNNNNNNNNNNNKNSNSCGMSVGVIGSAVATTEHYFNLSGNSLFNEKIYNAFSNLDNMLLTPDKSPQFSKSPPSASGMNDLFSFDDSLLDIRKLSMNNSNNSNALTSSTSSNTSSSNSNNTPNNNSTTNNNKLNNFSRSHSSHCVIYNRRCTSSIQKFDLNESIFPFSEDLENELDNSNTMNNSLTACSSNSFRKSSCYDDVNTDLSNIIRKNENFSLYNNKITSVLNKPSHNKYSLQHSLNLMSSSASSSHSNKYARSSSLHKYNSHRFNGNDSAKSLNQLKMLIKSKIKMPKHLNTINNSISERFNKSSSNNTIKRDKTRYDMEIVIEMIKDITNELDLKCLSEKIVSNLKLLVNADKASLFYVCHSRQMLASFRSESPIVSFDSSSSLSSSVFTKCDSSMINDFSLEFPFGSTILGHVAKTGEIVNIQNASQEKLFNNNTSNSTTINNSINGDCNKTTSDYQINSLVCLPIKNFNNKVIAVVQLLNKSKTDSTKSTLSGFDENDLWLINAYLPFCALSINHSQLFDLYSYEYERNKSLLEVVHDLFEQQTNLDNILFRIMQRAQKLLKCQRCSILLIMDKNNQLEDHDSSRRAFDLFQSGKRPGQRRHSVEEDDGKKISRDLADYVIKTGNKINLNDAYNDPRFDPMVDSVWQFKTKALLCMPIRNRDNHIIGCAQIVNRVDQQPFDENDEQLFEAFCIFCGLGINNTLIYNQLEKSMAEKSVALEVLSYHATSSKADVVHFMKKFDLDDGFDGNETSLLPKIDLSSYVFDDFSLNKDEMVIASYKMFKNSGLMKKFQINRETLFLWLLTVRKNYRDVEYHNFNHAFNVCQSMFAIFENSSITNYLQDIEKLCLIVGCLCHDLDHRGTNNMFQVESHSALSQLYGTTGTLEKHHFNHCIMILNSPGHNIFSNMKPRTYALAISYIKEAILATDLADHFATRKSFEEAAKNRDAYWTEEPYCSLLKKNLMTCCDLAAATKPWTIHRDVVDLVTKEFFAQGDRERNELKKEPNEMMDARRSHELPRLQIGWIDNICIPLYTHISLLCDSFKGHIERIQENRQNWSALNNNNNNNNGEAKKTNN